VTLETPLVEPTPGRKYAPHLRVELIRDGESNIPKQKVETPETAAEVMRLHLGRVADEHMVVILLDAQNALIGALTVGTGSTDWCPASTRQAIRPAVLEKDAHRMTVEGAIRYNAVGLIVGHNHPSGSVKPSPEDVKFFRRLKDACALMEVRLLDCIIIGDGTDQVYSHGSSTYDLR
jgi:DNA repair protein RadC